MTAVAWWTLGTAVFVMAAVAMSAGFRLGPVRWAGDALARRREAELRAEKLLLSWLSPSQRDQYRSRGWFDVVSRGGNRYRICPWKVTRLDIPRCAYCIEAVPRVPAADEMLANKLLLETDEQRFLATARHHQLAELVEVARLGAHDHVVGAGHVLGLLHARDLGDVLGDLSRLADLGLDEDVCRHHRYRPPCVMPPTAPAETVPTRWWHVAAGQASTWLHVTLSAPPNGRMGGRLPGGARSSASVA